MALIPTWAPRGADVRGGSSPGFVPGQGAYCLTNGGGMPDSISQITISMWGAPRNNIGIISAETTGVFAPGSFSCEFGNGGDAPMPDPGANYGTLVLTAANHSSTYPIENLINFMTFSRQIDNCYSQFSGGIQYASSLYSHFIACIDFVGQTVQCYYNDASLGPMTGGSWGVANPLHNATSSWGLWPPGIYGEVWVAPIFTDLSVTANRRQFINADFSPVQLPNNGAVSLTGHGSITPAVYLRATPWQLGTDASGTPTMPSPAHPISEFLINRGTGAAWAGGVWGDTLTDYNPSGGTIILPPSTNASSGNSGNNFMSIMISGNGWGPPPVITSTTDLGLPATFRYALFSIWFKPNGTGPSFSWKSTTGSGGLQVDVDTTPTDPGAWVVRIIAFNGSTVIGSGTAHFAYNGFNVTYGEHVLVSIDTVGQIVQCAVGGFVAPVTMAWSAALPMTSAPAMELMAWDGTDECIGDLYYTDTHSFYDLTLTAFSGTTQQIWAFVFPYNPDIGTYQSTPNALGSNGQGPTNYVPRVYLRAPYGSIDGSAWVANLGTGGSFFPVPPLCNPRPPPPQIVTDAELYFNPTGGFVDFADVDNRRKFVAASGGSQWLGLEGELPMGRPSIYLSAEPGDAAIFAQNKGNAEDFAINGTIDLAGSAPACTSYVTTETGGVGAQPEWRLFVSDDGGRTWSLLVKPRDIGEAGEYRARLRWLKMGQFRQRLFRLESNDPVRRNIVGFYVDLSQGMG